MEIVKMEHVTKIYGEGHRRVLAEYTGGADI